MVERAWRTLRERSDIEFVLCDLPPGCRAIYATRDGHRAILVSRDLNPAERLAALAHELHHDTRGGGCHDPDLPPLLRVVTAKEERIVNGLVADELLPTYRLRPYVEARAELGMVLAREVAEDFDVPVDVADLALRRLASGF